jgi:hypothetical protein
VVGCRGINGVFNMVEKVENGRGGAATRAKTILTVREDIVAFPSSLDRCNDKTRPNFAETFVEGDRPEVCEEFRPRDLRERSK